MSNSCISKLSVGDEVHLVRQPYSVYRTSTHLLNFNFAVKIVHIDGYGPHGATNNSAVGFHPRQNYLLLPDTELVKRFSYFSILIPSLFSFKRIIKAKHEVMFK